MNDLLSRPLLSRSSARFAAWLLASTPVLAGVVAPAQSFAKSSSDDRIPIIVVPTQPVGEVRPTHVARVAKALNDKLQATGELELLTDRSRPEKGNEAAAKAPVVTAAGTKLEAADLLRQEATDLASEGQQGPALAKFKQAIAAYQAGFVELVDFTKLADAFARAGVCAFTLGSTAEATRLWEDGVSLQPTLVIDRRKQPKELLDAFDAVHTKLDGLAKVELLVDGAPTEGAEAFVDGVRVGPLPAKATGLTPGKHYVQVRGDAVEPWATTVAVGKKGAKTKAKIIPIKVASAEETKVLAYADLTPCAQTGAFHTPVCKRLSQQMGKQTGARFVVFSAVATDRFGKVALQAFVADASHGGAVVLPGLELAADLSDLAQKLVDVEDAAVAVIQAFPKEKVVGKVPSFYTTKR